MLDGGCLMKVDLKKETEFSMEIAREAGILLRTRFLSDIAVSHKGAVDLVTEMDLASENLIRKRIESVFPADGFLGEEKGGKDWKTGRAWVVDPLDGTTNYAHGIPQFCVSVALCLCGEPIVGTVYRPASDEMFSASKGNGAFMNGQPLHVSNESDLNETLAVTGFPYDRRNCIDLLMERLKIILNHVQGVRRFGSAALDLCMVASGRFGIFYETHLNPWDVAAGKLIVDEAGGRVSDFKGNAMPLDAGELLATNGILHSQAVQLLGITSEKKSA